MGDGSEKKLWRIFVFERFKNVTQKQEGSERRKEYSPLVSASEASHSSSRPYAGKESNSCILIYLAWTAICQSPSFTRTKPLRIYFLGARSPFDQDSTELCAMFRISGLHVKCISTLWLWLLWYGSVMIIVWSLNVSSWVVLAAPNHY